MSKPVSIILSVSSDRSRNTSSQTTVIMTGAMTSCVKAKKLTMLIPCGQAVTPALEMSVSSRACQIQKESTYTICATSLAATGKAAHR